MDGSVERAFLSQRQDRVDIFLSNSNLFLFTLRTPIESNRFVLINLWPHHSSYFSWFCALFIVIVASHFVKFLKNTNVLYHPLTSHHSHFCHLFSASLHMYLAFSVFNFHCTLKISEFYQQQTLVKTSDDFRIELILDSCVCQCLCMSESGIKTAWNYNEWSLAI